MQVFVRMRLMLLAGCGLLAALPAVSILPADAQATILAPDLATDAPPAATLPDAPAPADELALAGQSSTTQDTQPGASGTAQAPAASSQSNSPNTGSPNTGTNASSGSTSSSTSNSQSGSTSQSEQQSQREKAEQQLKQQKQQRVLGVVPNFNISYVWNAASLTAGQKMDLAFRSAIDPFAFAAAGIVAGLHEALDEDSGFGWGAEGYFKRAGAAYLDSFDGAMIGNGILPSLLHQDPRYFRLGHGTFHHRLFYAISTSFICRHDNTGKWEPNYSNVGGNIAAGAISNLYYPSQNSGWGQTISNGFIVTAEGTVGGVFNEFWPDISRRVLHKDPTHGADARAAEQDKANRQH